MRISVVAACLLIGGHFVAAQAPSAEYRVKAAFLTKFPEFTAWPDGSLAARKAIDICVAGPNPFGQTLAELVADRIVHGLPLVTRRIDSAQAVDTCQVVFIASASPGSRKAYLARAAARPVLTVGDAPDFLDEGGIVQLRMIDGRVRFEVNAEAADRAGVRLSAQLLRLAIAVRGRPS